MERDLLVDLTRARKFVGPKLYPRITSSIARGGQCMPTSLQEVTGQ